MWHRDFKRIDRVLPGVAARQLEGDAALFNAKFREKAPGDFGLVPALRFQLAAEPGKDKQAARVLAMQHQAFCQPVGCTVLLRLVAGSRDFA